MILSSNRVGYKTLTIRIRVKLMDIRKKANQRDVPAVLTCAFSKEFLGNRKTRNCQMRTQALVT